MGGKAQEGHDGSSSRDSHRCALFCRNHSAALAGRSPFPRQQNNDSKYLYEYFLCARHCVNHLAYSPTFKPLNKPVRLVSFYPHFPHKETEVQRLK